MRWAVLGTGCRDAGLGEKAEEGSRLFRGRERGTQAGTGVAEMSKGGVCEPVFARAVAKPKRRRQGKLQPEWRKHVGGVESTPYHPCPRHL